jgi:translation initiation factor IF-3
VPEVRLIDQEGEQVGVISTQNALQRARDVGLDLVEISPNAEPPVCRIMDRGKYLFEQNKRRAMAKKKQKQVTIKEIKFRPSTDIGDYNIKLRKITTFLTNGDKVKVTVRFRGREMQHRELGMDILRRVQKDLQDIVTIEQQPKAEGRQMGMVLAPVKSEIDKRAKQESGEKINAKNEN